MDIWKPVEFQIHHGSAAVSVAGYEHRNLGLHILTGKKDKAVWSLTHLGTGLSICKIKGGVRTVFPVATEIAEAGDWGFISMEGYKDRFPDARAVVEGIMAKHKNVLARKFTNHPKEYLDDIRPVAQQIAANR